MLKDQTRAPRCLAPKVAHVPESSAELNESPFQRCTCNIEMLTDWNFAHLPPSYLGGAETTCRALFPIAWSRRRQAFWPK